MSSPDNNIPWSESTLKVQERFKDNANSMRKWWKDSYYDVPENTFDGEWKSLAELYEEYKAYCDVCFYDKRKRNELSAMLRSKGATEKRMRTGLHFLVGRKKIENENNE